MTPDSVPNLSLTKDHENTYVSAAEAARLLGTCPLTVHRRFDALKIPGYRLGTGNHRRIQLSAILEILAESGQLERLEAYKEKSFRKVEEVKVDPAKPFLTTSQAAKALGVSLQVIRRSVLNGTIPSRFIPAMRLKPGRDNRRFLQCSISPYDLQRWAAHRYMPCGLTNLPNIAQMRKINVALDSKSVYTTGEVAKILNISPMMIAAYLASKR